jgi:lysozyme C
VPQARRAKSPLWVTLLAFASLTGCSSGDEAEPESAMDTEAQQLLAGRRFSEGELATLLRDTGFSEDIIPTMVCTAKWESSFYSGATNRNRNGSTDYGLFQINDGYWLGPCRVSRKQLLDPATNVACALVVYESGGLGSWYGYKAHKRECDDYRVSGGGGASPATCHSATLKSRVDEGSCVQSARDEAWYQCTAGKWSSSTRESGPAGKCSQAYPLGGSDCP